MIDNTVEDLLDPIYSGLRDFSEDQLNDLAEALSQLQTAVDEELARRDGGEVEDNEYEEEDEYEEDSPW